MNLEELQLDRIDFQCGFVLIGKNKFCALASETKFPKSPKMAQRMFILFDFTYICEQTYGVMKFNATRYISRLSDKHLRFVLRIATTILKPNFDELVKETTMKAE